MTETGPAISMFGPDFHVDPYPTYARLRDEAPVCRVTTPMGFDTWLVTRYEDARAALADPRLSKDMHLAGQKYLEIFGETSAALDENMLNSDPPNHTRLRRLVSKAFTPRRIEALRPRVEEVAEELLDKIAPHGEAELMSDFAFPLPVTIICDLLGVPPQDREAFTGWARSMGTFGFDDSGAAQDAERSLYNYLTRLIERKRAQPEEDMLSALIAARDGEGRLSESELISTAFLLLFAGHETTANFIGNAVLALLLNPEQMRLLLDKPALLPGAIEELLRYDGSVENATFRFAAEDLEIAGTRIPKGSVVTIVLNSANRDPARFTDPDRVDITRAENAHLAFGHGIHYCLGAPLARMEAQIGIGMLLHRLPNLCLAVRPDKLRWLPAAVPFRGLHELPVWFTPEVTHSRKDAWRLSGASATIT
ncbi:cytochrome P450 family protein [Carbonactinospora thermoautotrophica]|uniref:cytochrome P450 family protein n=1 Tax=Carbonactinospora thermoautotrophica TaxID=1469144 RepID=UPI000835F350|nr:cytochrome P450 [Carbonactinospora thermoautotrophica]